jgi:hypothetical protein
MTCPKCGSSEIRVSKSFRFSDLFQRVRGREACRCRKCRHRFFFSPSSEPGPGPAVLPKSTSHPPKFLSTRARKRLVRRSVAVVIFAVAALIFWLFLRYLTTERAPASDSGAVISHLSNCRS